MSALKNATPEASAQLRFRSRLSEVRSRLYSIPKSEFEKEKMLALIEEALKIASEKKALPETRADALKLVAWSLRTRQFSEEELQKIEQGASEAAKIAPTLEIMGALEEVRNSAQKSREKAGSQQTLF